ncbi:MAG: AAA family ATPase [Xanthobacteraceae bacterium]|nr:AAA family ATPase [Xanthobacteraceae bacterium]
MLGWCPSPAQPAAAAPATPERRRLLAATPFVWRHPSEIPRRDWLYGHHLIRRFLSATVAPGAVGKSSLLLVEALAMARRISHRPRMLDGTASRLSISAIAATVLPQTRSLWWQAGHGPIRSLRLQPKTSVRSNGVLQRPTHASTRRRGPGSETS